MSQPANWLRSEKASPGPKVGDRVVLFPIKYCGHCEYCQQHLENICPNRSFLGVMSENGTFADYICLPEPPCAADAGGHEL
jgi:D-arabinose 1-dehydrogenase-like Zn-dependent alcohol dehydrogenase